MPHNRKPTVKNSSNKLSMHVGLSISLKNIRSQELAWLKREEAVSLKTGTTDGTLLIAKLTNNAILSTDSILIRSLQSHRFTSNSHMVIIVPGRCRVLLILPINRVLKTFSRYLDQLMMILSHWQKRPECRSSTWLHPVSLTEKRSLSRIQLST